MSKESAFKKWWDTHTAAKGKGCGLHMITNGLLGWDAALVNTIVFGDSSKIILGSYVKEILMTDLNFNCGPMFNADWGTKYKGSLDYHIVRVQGSRFGYTICNLTGDVKKAIEEKGQVAKTYKKACLKKNVSALQNGLLALKKKVLTNTKETIAGSIQNINKKCTTLGDEITELRGDVARLTNEQTDAQETVTRLANEKAELKNEISRLYEEQSRLSSEVQYLGLTLTEMAESEDEVVGEEEDL